MVNIKQIENIIKSLPNDNAYTIVAHYLKRSIEEIKKVQTKKYKKHEISLDEKWKFDLQSGMLKQPMKESDALKSLSAIDNMIKKEQEVLEKEKNKGSNEDIGPIFG